jgi:cytosine/creatinine deaminase
MTTQPWVLRGRRVLRTGATRPQCLDMVIGPDGRITTLTPSAPAVPGAQDINLIGRLITPGLIDAHQHLDKSRTRREVPNRAGTLGGAIAAFRAYAEHRMAHAEILARTERTMEACLARGTVVMRSHANVDPVLRTRSVEALIDLRERWHKRLRSISRSL